MKIRVCCKDSIALSSEEWEHFATNKEMFTLQECGEKGCN